MRGNDWLTGLVGSLLVLGLMVVLWKGGPALGRSQTHAAARAWLGARLGSAVRG